MMGAITVHPIQREWSQVTVGPQPKETHKSLFAPARDSFHKIWQDQVLEKSMIASMEGDLMIGVEVNGSLRSDAGPDPAAINQSGEPLSTRREMESGGKARRQH